MPTAETKIQPHDLTYSKRGITAMDALQIELAKLRRDSSLSQSLTDVDEIIAQLERAREVIVEGIVHPEPYLRLY